MTSHSSLSDGPRKRRTEQQQAEVGIATQSDDLSDNDGAQGSVRMKRIMLLSTLERST